MSINNYRYDQLHILTLFFYPIPGQRRVPLLVDIYILGGIMALHIYTKLHQ